MSLDYMFLINLIEVWITMKVEIIESINYTNSL